jgi:hypothetical protein
MSLVIIVILRWDQSVPWEWGPFGPRGIGILAVLPGRVLAGTGTRAG